MLENLRKIVEGRIKALKDKYISRNERRAIERNLRKKGMDQSQIEHEINVQKNKGEVGQIYELLCRSILQLGFYISPEIEYLPQGTRVENKLRAMTYAEHQKYLKEAGVIYKKATPESIKAHKEKESKAAAEKAVAQQSPEKATEGEQRTIEKIEGGIMGEGKTVK